MHLYFYLRLSVAPNGTTTSTSAASMSTAMARAKITSQTIGPRTTRTTIKTIRRTRNGQEHCHEPEVIPHEPEVIPHEPEVIPAAAMATVANTVSQASTASFEGAPKFTTAALHVSAH